ncbi:MAG: invasion associated locus B family protein [Methylocystis sp.]
MNASGAARRRFFSRLFRLATAVMLLAGAFALGAGALQPAQAEDFKGKFGEWDMRCETPPGASKQQCALVQRVTAEDVPGLNLIVLILKLEDGKTRLMRVIAPLGVLLPTGLGLMIDETKIGNTGFARCNQHGCIAEAVMDDKLLDQLKSGKTATYIVHEVPDKGIGLPVPLAGFKEGFAKLP